MEAEHIMQYFNAIKILKLMKQMTSRSSKLLAMLIFIITLILSCNNNSSSPCTLYPLYRDANSMMDQELPTIKHLKIGNSRFVDILLDTSATPPDTIKIYRVLSSKGQDSILCSSKNGKLHGPYWELWDDCKIRTKVNYTLNKREGPSIESNENGAISTKAYYFRDHKYMEEYIYYNNETIIGYNFYDIFGNLQYSVTYDHDLNIVSEEGNRLSIMYEKDKARCDEELSYYINVALPPHVVRPEVEYLFMSEDKEVFLRKVLTEESLENTSRHDAGITIGRKRFTLKDYLENCEGTVYLKVSYFDLDSNLNRVKLYSDDQEFTVIN